jgi:hypothetical protein
MRTLDIEGNTWKPWITLDIEGNTWKPWITLDIEGKPCLTLDNPGY